MVIKHKKIALTSSARASYGVPDSKVHGANMGPTWVLSAPDGPHVGLINLAIWGVSCEYFGKIMTLLYPRPTKLEGGYTGFTLSVCPSVRPSVCRRHGFRSISQVCFGISITNFICMLMVAIGRSLLIFSDVTFKMAAWRPYWIFWFPDSKFTLALNINFKLQRHNTYVYG